MLRATILSTETRTATVEGEGLESIREQLEAQRPNGFDLVLAPVKMAKASTEISATGTFARRDDVRELTGESLADLHSQTPEGWQILHVIRD